MLREYFLGSLHLIRDKKLQLIKSYGLNKYARLKVMNIGRSIII